MDQRDPHRKPKPRHSGPPPQRGRHEGERRPAAASGLWLYGMHPVEAALANPARRLRRLVLTEEAEAALAARLPKPWAIQAERIDRDRLDAMLGRGIVHQGMALQTDPLASPSLADALKRPGPVLVLDQITDPRNVGAIMRSAQAFGAALVIAQERNAPEEGGALAKAASGALERIPLLRTVNIARALIALKAADIWVMGLDAAGSTRLSGPSLRGRRAALVLGAEGEGLRRLTRETCDELVSLAMPGGMESLNVSAAAAVALYEIIR
jgi:23S rRNA (guanosine2251-2'-O)-methyltransferase